MGGQVRRWQKVIQRDFPRFFPPLPFLPSLFPVKLISYTTKRFPLNNTLSIKKTNISVWRSGSRIMALLNANMIAATSGTHPAPTPASKILRTAIIFNTILCYIFIPINASTYASNHHGYHALLPLQVTAFYAGFRLKYDSEERPLPCSLTEVILTGRSWVARATFEAFGLFILSLGLWALISGYTSSEGWSDGLDACGIIALILLSTNL